MEKDIYEKPVVEIIDFSLNDSIAANGMSMNFGSGAACTDVEY